VAYFTGLSWHQAEDCRAVKARDHDNRYVDRGSNRIPSEMLPLHVASLFNSVLVLRSRS
jgi:hypothetical protein